MDKLVIQGRTLQLVEGDITELDTDAIVNAANSHLQLGAGVAGAIRRKGGPSIQRECDRIGFCAEGDAVITEGGTLKARHVIHAVGPLGGDPGADRLLASACRRSLEVAANHGLRSVALPAISTGIFGFPIERAAHILLREAIHYLGSHPSSVDTVVFCLYGLDAFNVFSAELSRQVAD